MSRLMLTENQLSAEIEIEVAGICKPLFESAAFMSSQIEYFTYARYFRNGHCYFLTTNATLCQHHHKQKYHLAPKIETPFIDNKISYLPSLNTHNEAFNQAIYDYQHYFNYYHPIFFIEKRDDYLDMFIFATKSENLNIVNFYLNHMNSLEKFKSHFKSSAANLIKLSTDNTYAVPIEMRNNCDEVYNKISEPKSNIDKQYTASRYMLNGKHDGKYITQSEAAILKLKANGCSVKEMVSMLEISPKTIDSHLSNIKSRLHIKNRRELFEIAHQLLGHGDNSYK